MKRKDCYLAVVPSNKDFCKTLLIIIVVKQYPKLYLAVAAKHNSIIASCPSCPGFDSQRPKFFSVEKIVDVAEVNQWHCLQESGQWLENVGRTHLVLASGKLVLQATKNLICTE